MGGTIVAHVDCWRLTIRPPRLPGAASVRFLSHADRTPWSVVSCVVEQVSEASGIEAPAATKRGQWAAPPFEIDRRRNFAIISHPDAGKTTLTEKLLLYGGAIQEVSVRPDENAARTGPVSRPTTSTLVNVSMCGDVDDGPRFYIDVAGGRAHCVATKCSCPAT